MATTLGRTQHPSLIQHDIFLIRGDTARSRATRVSATTTGDTATAGDGPGDRYDRADSAPQGRRRLDQSVQQSGLVIT
jgi:hypothetical protein